MFANANVAENGKRWVPLGKIGKHLKILENETKQKAIIMHNIHIF